MSNFCLSGLKILDFSRILAGPFCTMLLGDLGAEIFKIEKPGYCNHKKSFVLEDIEVSLPTVLYVGQGDETRTFLPPGIAGQSCYFLSVNRNKKSIVIDLKKPAGVEIARRLAVKCNVLVENFLPGTMDKMGLGYENLKKINEKLIYCSITGYGPRGPYAQRRGYDLIAAAQSGFLHITGPEEGQPCKAGVAVSDLTTGLYAHGAILAALLASGQTGHGCKIDCNLLASQVSLLTNVASNFLNAGRPGRRWGTAYESITPYEVFETKNGGSFAVGALSDEQFRELCKILGLDLHKNVKFKSNKSRVENRQLLKRLLTDGFSKKTSTEWGQEFANCRAKLAYAPINDMKMALEDDPQVQFLNLVRRLDDHPTVENLKLIGPAVEFDTLENEIRSPPPLLGQHTVEVLKNELEFDDERINELLEDRVIEVRSDIFEC